MPLHHLPYFSHHGHEPRATTFQRTCKWLDLNWRCSHVLTHTCTHAWCRRRRLVAIGWAGVKCINVGRAREPNIAKVFIQQCCHRQCAHPITMPMPTHSSKNTAIPIFLTKDNALATRIIHSYNDTTNLQRCSYTNGALVDVRNQQPCHRQGIRPTTTTTLTKHASN